MYFRCQPLQNFVGKERPFFNDKLVQYMRSSECQYNGLEKLPGVCCPLYQLNITGKIQFSRQRLGVAFPQSALSSTLPSPLLLPSQVTPTPVMSVVTESSVSNLSLPVAGEDAENCGYQLPTNRCSMILIFMW